MPITVLVGEPWRKKAPNGVFLRRSSDGLWLFKAWESSRGSLVGPVTMVGSDWRTGATKDRLAVNNTPRRRTIW